MLPAIEFEGVTRWFGDTPAISDLSLTVEPGTVTILLGANGAGKSTTIRLATGVIDAHHGTVRLFGLDPAHNGVEVRRRCGVVPPKPALYENLTGRQNLAYAARLFEIDAPPIEREAERFGILEALDRPVSGYSTGMRARLALTRAMLHDPEVLLLDEPTAGLDPEAAVSVRETVLATARQGKTVVLSSHLLREAEGSVDQIVFMDRGRVWERGSPEELAVRYVGGTRVVLDADDRGALVAWIESRPDLTATESADGLVVAAPAGVTVSALVASAVAGGVGISLVNPVRPSLEGIYLEMRRRSSGEVS